MCKIWISSDTHLNHNKEFIWGTRGFKNVDEMNKTIIDNWNSLVGYDDIVYHLGDVWLGNLNAGYELFNQLHGNIYVALGNHDTETREEAMLRAANVVDVQMEYRLKYKHHTFILNHYPTIVTNYDDDGHIPRTICLCGHTHTKDPFKDWQYGCYHVEMDAHDFYPIALDDIITNILDK